MFNFFLKFLEIIFTLWGIIPAKFYKKIFTKKIVSSLIIILLSVLFSILICYLVFFQNILSNKNMPAELQSLVAMYTDDVIETNIDKGLYELKETSDFTFISLIRVVEQDNGKYNIYFKQMRGITKYYAYPKDYKKDNPALYLKQHIMDSNTRLYLDNLKENKINILTNQECREEGYAMVSNLFNNLNLKDSIDRVKIVIIRENYKIIWVLTLTCNKDIYNNNFRIIDNLQDNILLSLSKMINSLYKYKKYKDCIFF